VYYCFMCLNLCNCTSNYIRLIVNFDFYFVLSKKDFYNRGVPMQNHSISFFIKMSYCFFILDISVPWRSVFFIFAYSHQSICYQWLKNGESCNITPFHTCLQKLKLWFFQINFAFFFLQGR